METLSLDQLLEKAHNLKKKTNPTEADLQITDFDFYAHAPFWELHQAVCFLSGLASIDKTTFEEIISLNDIQISINRTAQVNIRNLPTILKTKISFKEFVFSYFPIPLKKIHLLKNLYDQLKSSIANGNILTEPHKVSGNLETLIRPIDVINWAEIRNIPVCQQLINQVATRNISAALSLPKTFPSEICFHAGYLRLIFEHNLNLPKHLPQSVYEPNPTPETPLKPGMIEPHVLDLPIESFIIRYDSPLALHLSKDGINQYKRKLQEYPADTSIFKKETINIFEAVFTYHNISFSIFEGSYLMISFRQMKSCLTLLERLEKIHSIFENYLHNHEISTSHIPWAIFNKFLLEKDYLIPSHFPESLKSFTLTTESAPEKTPKTKPKKETIRKEIFERAAYLFWQNEKAQGKKTLTPSSQLSKKTIMKSLVKIINEIGGIDEITTESGVDPEWLSPAFPEIKPGPKKILGKK